MTAPVHEQSRTAADVFEFGKNWLSFVHKAVTPESVAAAVDSLRTLLRVSSLEDKCFLDVGCGSGLSSLAALKLDAAQVVSLDCDPTSVVASTELRDRFGFGPDRWHVLHGSILDASFVATLRSADVVLAWGSLHSTGQMWQAIDNTVQLVRPGGVIAVTIYNHVHSRFGGSAQWWYIKRFYNQAPPAVRRLLEYVYFVQRAARDVLALRNPLARLRPERSPRGMDYWHDLRDWVGGFPYEYAAAGEVFNYLHQKHGLELIYLKTGEGHVCNEFTFRRPAKVKLP